MEFEWDEAKNEANFAKHGFDFEHAIQIFDGPIRQFADPRPWGDGSSRRPGRGRVHHGCLYASKWPLSDYFGQAGAAE
ncbi:MAG TPA: BrnT family toxin [Stellaceae bacterium]|jgi:uncharacterized DUF497 family protein|nr:BrnT family toxin [Stellaceae bacterium]